VNELRDRVVREIRKVVVGQDGVVEVLLASVTVGGHLLLEGVPGVAKTLMANAFARAIGVEFRRVQFTPDMLPSDLTGTMTLRAGELVFRPGPVFTNLVLADEINRTPPKTQAALLEAMQEQQVSVDGIARPLPEPFLVVATQNPIEYEGTYPLPEAQLDRFMMRLSLGYPSPEAEQNIIQEQTSHNPLAELRPVLEGAEVLAMTQAVTRVRVAPALRGYVVDLLAATRQQREIYLGASPRAGIALTRAAKALALLRGRDFVVPKDIKDLAVRVLAHRLMLSPDAKVHGMSAETVVARLLETVPVPQTGG